MFKLKTMGGSRTHCETFSTDGKRTVQKKKKYDSLDDAILEAKKLNARPSQIIKLVPYKCTVCHKHHLGRNGKEIKPKYRNKLIKELEAIKFEKKFAMPKFKIIGKIDLSKFGKKGIIKKKQT